MKNNCDYNFCHNGAAVDWNQLAQALFICFYIMSMKVPGMKGQAVFCLEGVNAIFSNESGLTDTWYHGNVQSQALLFSQAVLLFGAGTWKKAGQEKNPKVLYFRERIRLEQNIYFNVTKCLRFYTMLHVQKICFSTKGH